MNAREAITEISDMISDRHGDFHQQDDMLRYVNRAARYLGTESESVRSGIYIGVQEGRARYGLPLDFLQVDFVGFRYKDENRYYPLHPLRSSAGTVYNQNVSEGYLSDTGYPVYYNIWGRSAQEKAQAPVTMGGIFRFQIDNRPASIKIGDVVLNVTDSGAEGVITALDSESVTVDLMAGGVRNNFEVGDIVRILSADRSAQTIVLTPPPDFTSEPGQENLFVYHAHQHRTITQEHIDNGNDELEFDPNLEEAFLHRAAYHAAITDKTIDVSVSEYFDGKYNYHFKRAMPRVRQKIREFQSLWFSGQAIYRIRDVDLVGYARNAGYHTGNTVNVF